VQFIREGRPGSLAQNYITLGLTNGFPFFANPNAATAFLLGNFSEYNYNGLQIELRRRFSQGLYFQANYTWQKTLTDASGAAASSFQSRDEARIDNENPRLEYGRASYDVEHVFNFNGIYELPFGQGRRFLNEGGWLNRLVGGFQLGSIINIQTGAPLSILDARSTLNRTTPSANQSAFTTLTNEQIRSLFGIRRLPDGRVLFVDPSVLAPSGAATNGAGSATFTGQAFFNNAAGQTGNIMRGVVNGPTLINVDASLIKNIQITETTRVQLRAEAFNVFNRTNFFIGNIDDINSTNFGRIQTAYAARVMQFAIRFEF
jgi:hypothetical protein